MAKRIRILLFAACILLTTAMAADDPLRFSPWSEPVNLGPNVNTDLGEFFSCISKDGLSLYFTATANPKSIPPRFSYGGWDIYVCQRATVDDPWGPAQNLGPTINTQYDEVGPNLSIDGHRMYFASNRPGGFGGNDLYVSRRHNKRDDLGWQPPENLGAAVNTDANESHAAIFEDDDTGVITLYFDSNRPSGPGPYTDDTVHNGTDIYTSLLGPDEIFGPATLVAELSTPYADRRVAIRRDGLELFLSSDRPGRLGVIDLWVSTRASTSDSWSMPTNLGPVINGPGNTAGAALSFDATTLYFQASKPSHPGFGNFDLFMSTRTKLKGSDKDKE